MSDKALSATDAIKDQNSGHALNYVNKRLDMAVSAVNVDGSDSNTPLQILIHPCRIRRKVIK